MNFWGNYNKPVIFSESGAHEVWECDNFVETRRNIWQNMFWGIAGAFDWEIENMREDMKDFSIYSRIQEFMDGVDLEGGNWHSGMVKKKNDGTLRYKKSYRDDCIREDELADVVYLRSGDKEKAFGVITNRRANYYTLGEGDCIDNTKAPFQPSNPSLRTYGTVTPSSLNNRLRLRNMKFPKEFKIKYYSPYDLVNSIKEETRWGPKLTLEFPNMDTLDIVLFEVFPMGSNFKSMHSDTTGSKILLTKEPKKDKGSQVIVYPNPNDGDFVIFIDTPEAVKFIRISDNLGKQVNCQYKVSKENHYNKMNFKPGVYFVKVVFEDRIIRKKVVIH